MCSRLRYWQVKGSLSNEAACLNRPKFSFKARPFCLDFKQGPLCHADLDKISSQLLNARHMKNIRILIYIPVVLLHLPPKSQTPCWQELVVILHWLNCKSLMNLAGGGLVSQLVGRPAVCLPRRNRSMELMAYKRVKRTAGLMMFILKNV